MENVFAIALASMHQDMSRLDHTALNLANASTVAYKREVVVTQPFSQVLEAASGAAAPPRPNQPMETAGPSPLTAVQVLSDATPGTLRSTGNPFDLALQGNGFFEVNTETGPAYTRQGNFRIDAQGRLVTQAGNPVMGRTGEIFLTTQTPKIDSAGRVTEPDGTGQGDPRAPVAQLKLVRFDDARSLQRVGEGLFANGAGLREAPEGEIQVRQGSLENANVSSVQEMVQLMQTTRHFESMQKVAQGYDEMLGTAIRKLGDLT